MSASLDQTASDALRWLMEGEPARRRDFKCSYSWTYLLHPCDLLWDEYAKVAGGYRKIRMLVAQT